MTNAITRTAIAAAIALSGTFGVATLTAGNAAAAEIHSGIFVVDHHRGRDLRHRGWLDERRMRDDSCHPELALRKADRMGIRHARIVRADRHRIVVRGRHRAWRSSVVFANRHSCPVIAYRR